MNKELVKKIIKAKKYEYDIMKEILPDSMSKRVDKFEREALNLLKDVILEGLEEDIEEKPKGKTAKKVDVDFS